MDVMPPAVSVKQKTKIRRKATATPRTESHPLITTSVETISAVGDSLSPARRKIRWRWGVLAAVAMALVSMYPQIDLWLTRGRDWQGTQASTCVDEEQYVAYINGLILGRPRRSQPLAGPSDGKPQAESFLAIQFVPAYLIALPARALGLNVAQAFIVLTPLAAFLSTLIIFYLLALVTRDEALATVGALIVLIFSALAARFEWAKWINLGAYFPFIRRYEPAAVFPIFFCFVALVWHAFTQQGQRAWRPAIAAGLVFSALIFSYFYLWTAAVAWLACFVLVWLVARAPEWPLLAKRLAPTAFFGVGALTIYAMLLANRASSTDTALSLVFTHAPDFYRVPQFISVASILLFLWGVKQGRIQWREPAAILISSLALMPFVVFNQQIITGRSLQPIHYEAYIANYVSLLAVIFTIAITWPQFTRRLPKLLLPGLACVALGCGVIEVAGNTMVNKPRNTERDLFMPVAKRLATLATEHGKGSNDREVVFSPNISIISDNIAAFAPQVPLLATHLPSASGLPQKEQEERYFQYSYYCGTKPSSLARELINNNFYAIGLLFGYERYIPQLVIQFKPVTTEEITEKVQQYEKFVTTFNHERARHPELSYVVVYTKAPTDFSNLDRWYVRDKGEQIGPFTLYQVRLR